MKTDIVSAKDVTQKEKIQENIRLIFVNCYDELIKLCSEHHRNAKLLLYKKRKGVYLLGKNRKAKEKDCLCRDMEQENTWHIQGTSFAQWKQRLPREKW
jgi:hypothetical protein